jgi:hypothetical protein
MVMCKTRGKKVALHRKKDREVKHRARVDRRKWMSWLEKQIELQLRVVGGNISGHINSDAKEDSKESKRK